MSSLQTLRSWFRPQPHARPNEPDWPTLYLPRLVAEETARLVASFGTSENRHEGIAYWAGVASAKSLVVTTVLVPEATTTAGSFETSVLANARVIQVVNASRLLLLAQVHGHPDKWVGHSQGDDAGAFMPYRGFFSVVLPHYGRRGVEFLAHCGFHRFDGEMFHQLDPTEVARRIVLVDEFVDLRGGRRD
jgi:hypothetical protein